MVADRVQHRAGFPDGIFSFKRDRSGFGGFVSVFGVLPEHLRTISPLIV
jgi:hypothetical protein